MPSWWKAVLRPVSLASAAVAAALANRRGDDLLVWEGEKRVKGWVCEVWSSSPCGSGL
jgi:hypothetical protein